MIEIADERTKVVIDGIEDGYVLYRVTDHRHGLLNAARTEKKRFLAWFGAWLDDHFKEEE